MRKLRLLLPYLKGSRGLLALSLVGALFSTGAKLAIPFFAGRIINDLSAGSPDFELIETLTVAIFALIAVGTIFRFVFDYFTNLVGAAVLKRMRDRAFRGYVETDISHIDNKMKGGLISTLVNDVEKVQTGLVSGFAALYDGVVAILITMVFMFTINWLLALMVVLLTPASMLVSRFVSRYNAKHFKAQASGASEVNSYALESLTNSEAVVMSGCGESRKKEFDAINSSYRKSNFKANMGASIINPSTRLVNALINVSLIIVGCLLLISNDAQKLGITFMIGDLSAFLTYASNYMQPFNEISDVIADIDAAFASLERVDEAASLPKDASRGNAILGTIESVSSRGLGFSYEGSKRIIKGFDMDVKKGQAVALVGPTGCGKTTMMNLLLRFYDAQEGVLAVNGMDVREYDKKKYRARLGIVLQDSWIFTGTVHDNIAYAKPEATREEVIEAAKRAQAHEFIERLSKGYDTPIGDSSGLSTGEKQLISVARIMLSSPELIILDEATSSIDVRTENILNASFHELMKGKTSFIVAHRLSTIRNCDLILVMKDGEIVEQGRHAELLEKQGFYASIYNSQMEQ